MKRALSVLSSLVIACSGSTPDAQPPPPDSGVDAPIANTDPLLIETETGPLRGADTANGRVFFDIPYAAAPTGELRFAPPARRPAWTSERDATKRGLACPQPADAFTRVKPDQAEDCLALNVWTPKPDASTAHPVMVFIHGGSFKSGSGNLPVYDGANLTQRGVVVVTINYRLGPLGFFATPGGPSGNQGFLDQQAALRWVQTNIAKFGGDPAMVTIFGESAGGISVCLHMVSPGSKGLFHRAIAESGTCALVATPLRNPTPAEDSAEERGARLVRDLGCSDLACVRGKTPDQILAAGTGGAIGSTELGFAPAIDGTVIPNAPQKVLGTAAASAVPFIVGANADEASIFTTQLMISTAAEYEGLVRTSYPAQADEILKLYPASAFPTPKAAYNTLVGDALFVCPARSAAKLTAPRVPTYLYHFTHVTTFAKTYNLGAFHASELWFVFGNFTAPLTFPSAEERSLADAMGGYWTDFAKTGTPSGAVAWPKFALAEDKHLVLGTSITTGAALSKERCDGLERLFP